MSAPEDLGAPVGVATRFLDWLEDASSGPVLTYWEGDLVTDAAASWTAKAVRAAAQEAQEAGRVCLTQRRLGEGLWAYLATRRVGRGRAA